MENNTNRNLTPLPGHANCLLFTELPYDIRVMIYREFFRGSRQEVVSRPDREDPHHHFTASTRLCLPLNRQFNLVRACKEIYKESRHIYWSETAIKLAYRPLAANLSAIPQYARQCVRALEGVPIADALSSMNQIPIDQFLGRFPRLNYCQFNRITIHMDCHSNEIDPNDMVEESGSDALLEIAVSLNKRKPPVFVQRIYLWPEKDHGRICWVYANHTHGRFFVTRIGSVSDEEGFEKVTGPRVEEIQGADGADNPDAAHEGNEVDDEHDEQDLHGTGLTDDATEVNDVSEVDDEDKLDGFDGSIEGDSDNE